MDNHEDGSKFGCFTIIQNHIAIEQVLFVNSFTPYDFDDCLRPKRN